MHRTPSSSLLARYGLSLLAWLPFYFKVHILWLAQLPILAWIWAFGGEVLWLTACLWLLKTRHRSVVTCFGLFYALVLFILHAIYFHAGVFFKQAFLFNLSFSEALKASIHFATWPVLGPSMRVLLFFMVCHIGLFAFASALPKLKKPAWFFAGLGYGLVALLPFFKSYEEQKTPLGILALSFLDHGETPVLSTHDPSQFEGFDRAPAAPLENVPPGKPYHLVLYVMESTRAISCTPYNPDVAATPFLNEVKDRGLFFESFYSNSTVSAKFLTTMLLGIYPRASISSWSQKDYIHQAIGDDHLTAILKQHGYFNAFFVNSLLDFGGRESFLRQLKFDRIEGSKTLIGHNDFVLADVLKSHFSQNGQKPLFSMLLSSSGHAPYPHDESPIGRKAIVSHANKLGVANQDIYWHYLNSLHHQDAVARRLYEVIEELGHLDDTIFVVVGDHGESFGEHGRLGGTGLHGLSLFEESIRVPLWIHHPDLPPQHVESPAQVLDLIPTLIAMAGIEAPNQFLGRNILLEPRPQLYFSNYTRVPTLGLIEYPYKLIRYGQPSLQTTYALYNLQEDPFERHELKPSHERFLSMKQALDQSEHYYQAIKSRYESFRNTSPTPPPAAVFGQWTQHHAGDPKLLKQVVFPHIPKPGWDLFLEIEFHNQSDRSQTFEFAGFGVEGTQVLERTIALEPGDHQQMTWGESDPTIEFATVSLPEEVRLDAALVNNAGYRSRYPTASETYPEIQVGGPVQDETHCGFVLLNVGDQTSQVELKVLDASNQVRHQYQFGLEPGTKKGFAFDLREFDEIYFHLSGEDLAYFDLRWLDFFQMFQ